MQADRPPAIVLAELGRAMRVMTERAEEYAQARRAVATFKGEYDQAMSTELVKLRDEYRSSGERLPSEEMRRAICHQRVGDQYRLMLAAEAEHEALARLVRSDSDLVSGLQSELRFLQTTELL